MLNINLRDRLSKLVIEGPQFLEMVDSLIMVAEKTESNESTMVLGYSEEGEVGEFSVELHIVVKRTTENV